QHLLGALAGGDLGADADHAHGLARLVAHQLAAPFHPVPASVGPDDAVLELMLAALQRLADALLYVLAIVRMDVLLVRREVAAECPGSKAVDRLQLRRPDDLMSAQVPLPGALAPGLERDPQPFLAVRRAGHCASCERRSSSPFAEICRPCSIACWIWRGSVGFTK